MLNIEVLVLVSVSVLALVSLLISLS
jgi:hypothetical protein